MTESNDTEHERLSTSPPYDLPASVDSNIPRVWSVGDPAAWSVARGILSELCHELQAAPISLLYQELIRPLHRDFTGLRITARARPRHGNDTIVIYRSESAQRAPSTGRWSLAVNGLIPVSRVSRTRPQPRAIAHLTRLALDTGTDT